MKQTGVASVSPQSSSLAAALRRWLTDTSLRLKLYIGLGVSVCGLLIVAGVTSYTSALNQQVVNETMTRQRHLTSLVSEIGSLLLNIQNQVLEFYETWSETGFERADQGGFEEARRIYVAPVQEQIQQIRDNVAEIERLELGEQDRASLTTIMSSVDAYEVTLLQMSDHMEDLGFAESGELGQMQAAMDELRDRLDEPGLESFYVALLEIGGREKEFLLHSDVASAGLTQDLITQLEEQITAADDDLLSPLEKAQLNDLLASYRDHFLAAANRLFLVDRSQRTLIGQSDLTSLLVGNLFEQQQTELAATVEQLRERQANLTATMIGLSLLVFAISISVVYFVSGQITRPVQMLGETARQLGAGDLNVRATVYGQDEIGVAATAFNMMAGQLQTSLADLEQRVVARTRGLQAAAEVARATTSVLDPDQLLREVVNLARERFGLYYVGLFLLDEERRFAVLRAGTGEAGREMLARGHALEVGGDSMIGQCTFRAEARIALDVGEEAARFDNPLLPDTRSEMALPLIARGRVIGAMTVQSVDEAAFDEADIIVMQTMADQVAVAIDNARLFADTQAALEGMVATQRRYLGQAWTEYVRIAERTGYETERPGVAPLGDTVLPEIRQAMMQGSAVVLDGGESEGRSTLVAPVALRGEIIGALGIHDDKEMRQWTSDDIAMIEAIAERMALAAENLRLLDETQRHAARDRLTAQVTARMRETLDVETILQTAVREMREALELHDVTIQLGNADSSASALIDQSEQPLEGKEMRL